MKRWAVPLLLVVAVGVLLPALPIRGWVDGATARVATLGAWAPAAMVGLYALLTVAMVPGSALTIASGLLFGTGKGFVVVTAGANLGALAAFLLARTIFRRRAEALAAGQPRLRAIRDAIGEHGLVLVTLLRLSPVFPFVLLNVLLGVTGVRVRDFALGTLVGMIPGTLLFVSIGAAGGEAAGGAADGWTLALRIAGLAATLAVTVVAARIARRALARVEAGAT